MAHDDAPPADFEPLFRTSPFLDLVGPMYAKRDGEGVLVIGFRVERKHLNARGTVHGGMLTTLADVALGYATAFSTDPPARLTTTQLSIDFAGAAELGDWIEAHVDLQRLGSRLAFANAYLVVEERRFVRASAVFIREARALTEEPALANDEHR